MSIRIPSIVSLFVVAAMLAVSAWGWAAIPGETQIAVHWGIDLKPDRYLPKTATLFLLPCSAALLSAYFALLPKIEPRRANLAASRKLYLTEWYSSLGIAAIVHLLLVTNGAGLQVNVLRWIFIAQALLLAVLGNFLGKSRATFFIGFRLPWTLSSDLAWEKSNRLAGRGLVATGAAALPAVFFAGTMPGVLILATGTLLSFASGGIAAYLYWKRDSAPRNGTSVHE